MKEYFMYFNILRGFDNWGKWLGLNWLYVNRNLTKNFIKSSKNKTLCKKGKILVSATSRSVLHLFCNQYIEELEFQISGK